MGRELVSGDSHAPHRNGGGGSAPNFGGSLIYAYNTSFDVVTHMGMGLILGGQLRPRHYKGWSPSAPQFLLRDAMRKGSLCCRPVSVRPSVTLVYCIQMAEAIVKLLSLSGSPIILTSSAVFIHSLHEYYYSVISPQAFRTLNIVTTRQRNSKLCASGCVEA